VHVKRNKTKHFPTRQNTVVSNVYRQCFCFESTSLAGATLGYISFNHMHSRRSQGPALVVSDTNSSLQSWAPVTSQHRQWSAGAVERGVYLGLQFGWRGTCLPRPLTELPPASLMNRMTFRPQGIACGYGSARTRSNSIPVLRHSKQLTAYPKAICKAE
jgi:hypothetical protein